MFTVDFLARHYCSHLADGETEAQGGSSTCAESCNESVTDPKLEGGNPCIPVPLSDHLLLEPGLA